MQAAALCRVGAADAVVLYLDHQAIVGARDPDRCSRCVCVLGHVRERLDDDVVRGRLDRLRIAVGRDGQLDRHGCPVTDHVERGREAALGQRHRMDAPCQLAQVVERARQLVDRVIQALLERGVVRGLDPQCPQREQQDHEPLLGAVVEVALEPATGFVGRGDDPCARGPHLFLLPLALPDIGAADQIELTLGDVGQGRAGPRDVDRLSAARQPATVLLGHGSVRDRVLDRRPNFRSVVRRDVLLPEEVAAGCAGLVPEQALERDVARAGADTSLDVDEAERARSVVGDRVHQLADALELHHAREQVDGADVVLCRSHSGNRTPLRSASSTARRARGAAPLRCR